MSETKRKFDFSEAIEKVDSDRLMAMAVEKLTPEALERLLLVKLTQQGAGARVQTVESKLDKRYTLKIGDKLKVVSCSSNSYQHPVGFEAEVTSLAVMYHETLNPNVCAFGYTVRKEETHYTVLAKDIEPL